MANEREQLLAAAQEKWQRDQLIAAAQAKWEQSQKGPETPSAPLSEQVEAGARSALNSASLGLSEPVVNGLNAVVGTGIDTAMDDGSLSDRLKNIPDRLVANYKQSQARKGILEKEAPTASTVGEVAGFLAPVGPAAALAKTAGAAGRAAASAIPLVSKLAPRVAPMIGESGAIGAGISGAMQGIQNLTGAAGEDSLSAASAAGSGAEIGAGLGAGMAALGKIPTAAAWAASKAMKTYLGVSPELASEYLARRSELANAKSFDDVAQIVHSAVSDIGGQLETSKLGSNQADALVKDLEGQLSAWQKSVGERTSDERDNLEGLVKFAKEKVKLAARNQELDLRRMAEVSREAPPEFVDATQALKDKVIEGKKNALSLLDQSQQTIELAPIRKAIADAQNSVKVAGEVIGPAKQVVAGLQSLQSDMAPLGKEVAALDARRLVELLDDQITYVQNEVGFTDPLSQKLSRIRYSLNESIGQKVPEFSNAMKEVATDAKLLDQSMKLFGNENRAYSTLKRLDQNQAANDIINQIQERTGLPIAGTSQQMLQARALLKDRTGLMESLPEHSELKQLQQKLEQFGDPALQAQMRLLNNPDVASLYQKIERSKMEQIVAQQKLATSESKAAAIQGLTPANTESKIKSLMNNSSIEVEELFKRLSQATDTDFNSMVKDMATMEKFNAGYQNGSRNVNLWTAIIGGVAGATGMGAVGIPIGATVGAAIDRYGPAMAKQILNQVSDIAAMPTVQKIQDMKLPDSVKEELKRDFVKVFSTAPNTKVSVSPDRIPAIAQTIQASDLGSMKKARMMDGLKSGYLENPRSLMMNEQPPSPKPYQQKKPMEKPTIDLDKFTQSKREPSY